MDKVVLKAEHRTVTGKQVNQLRRQGLLPGVLYGHNIEATPISVNQHEASRLLSTLTGSSLVTIDLDGQERSALVREKQRDYIRNTLLHVDFQVVSLTEKIRAKVGIELTGIAPAVKDYNGTVVVGIDSLEVEAFPQDLPARFTLDISNLKQIGDGIYLRDIPVSDKVQILDSPDEMVVVVTAAAAEEAPAEAAAAEEPEVIERGKKEEEEEGAG